MSHSPQFVHRESGSALPRAHCLGDAALVLEFGDRIDPGVNARVLAAWRALGEVRLRGVLDSVPAYATLTVLYDPTSWDFDSLAVRLQSLVQADAAPSAGRQIEIPVCYDASFADDLPVVCAHTGLSPGEVVRRHSATEYHVYFLGFTPGFPYLGGLDPALATPRRATPRTIVPAGAVAIGGAQTGVYPQATPGGWQIIGRTPLSLFDPRGTPPCLLAPGDTVRFVAVEAGEFARLAAHGRAG